MASADLVEARGSDSRIVARNSIILLGRYLSIAGLNVVLVLFLPRYLGAQGLGQLQFALSFVSLFAVGVGLGVRQFLIKEVARDRGQLPAYLGSAMGLRLLLAAFVFGAIALATEVSGHSETAKRVVYFAALWMIVTSFAHLMSTFLYGYESMGRASIGEIANKAVVAIVGIGLLLGGAGVAVYAAVLVVGALVELVVSSRFVAHLTKFRMDLNAQRMKMLVVGGMPFLLLGFLLNIYAHIDVVMLRFFSGEDVVGWHAAAFQIYRSLEFLPVVLTTALLPTLARMYKAGASDTASIASRSIGVVLLVMVPIGLGMSLVSAEIIAFMPYPDTFSNTVPVLRLLALISPVTALLIVFGTIVAAVDRQKVWALAMSGTVLLNIALNALAIPYFQDVYGNGAIGASAVTLVSESLMVLVGIWLVPKSLFNRHLVWMSGKVALAAGAMTLIVLAGKTLGLGLFPLTFLGAAGYIGITFATRAVGVGDILFLRSTIASRMQARTSTASHQEIN